MAESVESQNDLEICTKMEDEHLRLQRQVRMIQIDREHRIMGVHPQFRRQDHLLRTLKKEYLNLVKNLKIAKSGAHKKKDKRMKADLNASLLLRMKLDFERDGGLALMEQLDGLLQQMSKETLQLRDIANSTAGELEERKLLSEARLISTENKLEVVMWRFNTVQSENKKIREEIEHMLKDRAIFNQAWSKMLSALHKGKKFLTDLFESSTLAYDQRDEWCTKLRSVQEKGKMDQMLQIQEMRDLQKAYDHEMKLYYFLAKKGVMRINTKQEELEEQEKIKEDEELKQQYDAHVKIIEDINDYTHEPDIDKIIEAFERREQSNFSTYELLTEFCAENESLSREVNRLRRDIEDRRDWNEVKENKEKDNLEILKEQLRKLKCRTEELRNKEEDKVALINGTMQKVEEMFNRPLRQKSITEFITEKARSALHCVLVERMIDCSLEPFQNLLGDKQPSIHHLNLTFCLITEKIKELVQTVYYYERQVEKKKSSCSRLKRYTVHHETLEYFTPRPINTLVPNDPCPSCVEARWLSRVTDTPEIPFNRSMALKAIRELTDDPAYERSDRVHALADCRVPRSRMLLARRYMQY